MNDEKPELERVVTVKIKLTPAEAADWFANTGSIEQAAFLQRVGEVFESGFGTPGRGCMQRCYIADAMICHPKHGSDAAHDPQVEPGESWIVEMASHLKLRRHGEQ